MASVPSAAEYLAPGFEPSSLKVAQLRGILYEHSISIPGAAKKADLVALFEEKVRIKAKAYEQDAASVVASADGIMEVDNDGIESTPPPPERAVRKLPRASKPRSQTEEDALNLRRTRRQTRSQTPLAPPIGTERIEGLPQLNRLPSFSETDEEEDVFKADAGKKKKRTLKNKSPVKEVALPLVEDEVVGFGTPQTVKKTPRKSVKKEQETSGFSSFNPFQAGDDVESNVEAPATVKANRRRTTVGTKRSKANLNEAFMDFPDPVDTPTRVNVAPPSREPSPLKRISPDLSKRKVISPVKTSPKKETIHSPTKGAEDEGVIFKSGDQDIDDELEDVTAYNRAVETRLAGLRKQDRRSESEEPEGDSIVVHVPMKEEKQEVKTSVVRTSKKAKPETALVKPQKDGMRSDYKIGFSVLFGLGAILHWVFQFQQSSVGLGYCDNDRDTNSIIRTKRERLIKAQNCVTDREQRLLEDPLEVGESRPTCAFEQDLPLFSFVPTPESCAACPEHAVCENGQITTCLGEYILEPSSLNWLGPVLNGLPGFGPVAFPPSCEFDVKKRAQVAEIARAVHGKLAVRKGEVLCGSRVGRVKGGEIERFGLSESELYEAFVKKAQISSDQFKINFKAALDDLVAHNNVLYGVASGTPTYAAIRAEMPISCRMRIAATEKVVEARKELSIGASTLALLAYLYAQYKSKRAENIKVKKLVKTALSRLQDQQYTHYIDQVQAPEPFLKPNQLRDFVLDHVHNASARQRLWAKVAPVIETNANVRVGEQEVMGDTWKIWEWVGVSKTDTYIETSESLYPEAL